MIASDGASGRALPDHGPCLVGGTVTLDDVFFTTDIATNSGGDAIALYRCATLLHTGSRVVLRYPPHLFLNESSGFKTSSRSYFLKYVVPRHPDAIDGYDRPLHPRKYLGIFFQQYPSLCRAAMKRP